MAYISYNYGGQGMEVGFKVTHRKITFFWLGSEIQDQCRRNNDLFQEISISMFKSAYPYFHQYLTYALVPQY